MITRCKYCGSIVKQNPIAIAYMGNLYCSEECVYKDHGLGLMPKLMEEVATDDILADEYMDRDDMMELLKMLARHQGRWARFIEKLERSDYAEEFWLALENRRFTSEVKLIMFLEFGDE